MDNNRVKIQYYIYKSGKNPFSDFLDSLSTTQQSKILRVFAYLEQYKQLSIIPHIRKLTGTPFWEIRILGKDNIRVIFVSQFDKFILVLHGFIKKTKKTPLKEISLSFSRYRDWLNKNNLDI